MHSFQGKHGLYRTVKKLGAGGNGDVWLALGPAGEVALKMLRMTGRAPKDAKPRFDREVAALEQLSDLAGVLPLLDCPPTDSPSSECWFTMPLAVPLQRRLGADATLPQVCAAGADFADALARVHERGFSHRDIKPDNLYWHQGSWCLGDFGLVKIPDEVELTESGRKLGPAFYIAPEMLNQPTTADGKIADVYSLGKTIWVLATGQNYPMPGVHEPSFPGVAIATYHPGQRGVLLDELVRRMTLLDPAQRPSATAVARELQLLAKEPEVTATPDPDESLRKLRVVLAPHFAREADDARNERILATLVDTISDGIRRIGHTVEAQSGLKSRPWYDLPKYWGYHLSLGGHSIDSTKGSGLSFEAGGKDWTWRLSVGFKCQLLSNGMVVVHAGYSLDRLFKGRSSNTSGMPPTWDETAEAPNGSAESQELAQRILNGLNEHLASELDQFTRLLENVAD